MKRTAFCVLLLTSLMIACQSEPANDESQQTAENTNLPGSVEDVEAAVSAIQNGLDTLQERGPISVTRGEENWEIYAYYADQDPRMLRAIYSGGEQVYYFQDRRVIRLQEFANIDNGLVEERVFSYTENDMVEAKARRGAARLELAQKNFRRYRSPYGDDDFRMDVNQVNGSATGFIYGQ